MRAIKRVASSPPGETGDSDKPVLSMHASRTAVPPLTGRLLLAMGKKAISAWIADYAPSMGAAISYYTMFSIAPLLLIVIAVAGMVFDQNSVREQIVVQLRALVGNAGANAVRQLLLDASQTRHTGLQALVGVGTLLLGATSVFTELQGALDRIWRRPSKLRAFGLWSLVRTRLLSIGLILGIGFLLAVSLALSTALHAFSAWWGSWFSGWYLTLAIINGVVSFGVVTLLFAFIYKALPQVSLGWGDVGLGAVVTAALFEAGKELIGLYLGASGVTTAFGAAGSLVVLLVWVYYSAQVFLLGAEFTWVYAHEVDSLRGRKD
jgi:membrane protein